MTSLETRRSTIITYIRTLPRWKRVACLVVLASVVLVSVLYAHNLSATKNPLDSMQSSQSVTSNMELLRADRINLPASHLEADGLHLEPVPFAVVNQNGSGGQPNDPVNLYGAHLKVSGDFAVEAHMKDIQATATLSLYGDVPVIYDEFRYERNTLKAIISGDRLTVQTWKHDNQQPVVHTYTLPQAKAPTAMTITRQGGNLLITIDNQQVAKLAEDGLFASGTVWFGATAEQQPWVLRSLMAVRKNNAPLKVVSSINPNPTPTEPQGLQYLLNQKNKRPGFTLGSAVALGPLVADPEYLHVVLGQNNFGTVTTENALKRQFTEPLPGVYDFPEADAVVALAQRYGLKVKAHPLVFGEANPRWLQELPTGTPETNTKVEQTMTDYIHTVLKRYGDKLASADVVNEPLSDYDQFEQGQLIRDSIWSQAMGKDYIVKAFQAARAATADIKNPPKLGLNEFGLEEDGERWDYFFELVTELRKQGLIDYVGFQSHVYERGDRINFNTLKSHMNKLAAIGVTSQISEMDVYSSDGTKVQAGQYAGGLRACLQVPSCTSMTVWGPSDRYNMWQDDDGTFQAGQDFLWDRNMQPTPAIAAMRAVTTSQ